MTDMIMGYKLLPEITQWSFAQQQGFYITVEFKIDFQKQKHWAEGLLRNIRKELFYKIIYTNIFVL